MGIFVEQDGHSIKFFLQKDLPDDIQRALTDAIQAEEGRIESKVPIKGYVLIQPDTMEAERLRSCWTSQDRPGRYFVPYTWVDACRDSQLVLRQIFLHDGYPVKMHIHSSIANLNSRETLARRITHSGGDPSTTEHDARVILADQSTEVFDTLVKQYQGDPNKFVESHLWIKKCIDRGIYVHTPNVYKNPGGRRAGDERTSFTDDDEANLCNWIASVIPYKESGGRTGNKIYQELVSRVNEPGWTWVARHTWQSWRERYKKNAARLDQHIVEIVNLHQPPRGGKGQYGYIREREAKAPRKRNRKSRQSDANSSQVTEGEDPADMVDNVANDTMDSEAEWRVKVGEEPAPAWAKRKADDEAEGSSDVAKRLRTGEDAPANFGKHLIDQAIEDIASEFSFLVKEIRAYYDQTGDMHATKERFARIRTMINATP
ncbi:hypothetical protein BD410DRAFT_220818 [Rickenella mellea]|uniref:DNA-binding protein RAP1 n=1 Tax=Rickenella mellea TaxID=50990 RepID=A0A4Y7QM28_9AGAM|nr:hypothetical protein BD410DRAFT_220818 [Rickenella mellea]